MTVMRNNGEMPSNSFDRLKQKKRIFIGFVSLALVVLLVLQISVFVTALQLANVLREGRNRLTANRTYDTFTDQENGEYVYNRDVINILLMGIDKASDTPNASATEQADALYLFSFDTAKKQIYVIAISRNTLMDMDIYDMNHQLVKRAKEQICTAYAYGRTGKESAELTVEAVSRFFYNIPISGYYAIYDDAVSEIVGAVGGITVQLDEDMLPISPSWRKGTNVRLIGKYALKYLRFRGESNEPRLDRQKDFLKKFLTVAQEMTKKDLSLPLEIYQKIASKTVTNVDAKSVTYLASEAVQAEFQLISLKGEVGFDGFYETFTVDQENLYGLLKDVFYKKSN